MMHQQNPAEKAQWVIWKKIMKIFAIRHPYLCMDKVDISTDILKNIQFYLSFTGTEKNKMSQNSNPLNQEAKIKEHQEAKYHKFDQFDQYHHNHYQLQQDQLDQYKLQQKSKQMSYQKPMYSEETTDSSEFYSTSPITNTTANVEPKSSQINAMTMGQLETRSVASIASAAISASRLNNRIHDTLPIPELSSNILGL